MKVRLFVFWLFRWDASLMDSNYLPCISVTDSFTFHCCRKLYRHPRADGMPPREPKVLGIKMMKIILNTDCIIYEWVGSNGPDGSSVPVISNFVEVKLLKNP